MPSASGTPFLRGETCASQSRHCAQLKKEALAAVQLLVPGSEPLRMEEQGRRAREGGGNRTRSPDRLRRPVFPDLVLH